MCGITGIISLDTFKTIQTYTIQSLSQLQNRGYDSSGVSILQKNLEFKISKKIKKDGIDIFQEIENDITNVNDAYSVIGHNRWATHGGITEANAHPHMSQSKNFVLVHNGIFENYLDWKNILQEKGYLFKSETDTEVVVNMIDYFVMNLDLSIEQAINKLYHEFQGTFAILVQYKKTPKKLYAMKKGSPLLIGKNKTSVIATSEKSGFLNLIEEYIVLEPNDICIMEIEKDKVSFQTQNVNYNVYKTNHENYLSSPSPYPDWTKKEIFEQPETFYRVINNGGRLSLSDLHIKLGGISDHRHLILKSKRVVLLGCGTSLHACQYIKTFFKKFKIFEQIECIDGSEFDMDDIENTKDTIGILVSQSGETKDLYRCLPLLKSKKILSIGIINEVDSLIAREVDCGIYCNAGKEIGVASTKAFIAQVLVMLLLFLWIAQEKKIHESTLQDILKHYTLISEQIESILKQDEKIKDIAKMYSKSNSIFLLGKGCDEIISREGALKIKEITYIHAEAYNASALKHGPFALLDEHVPVILLCSSDQYKEKILNCYYEIKARDAPIIVVSNLELVKDTVGIIIPENKYFGSLLNIIPLQLLAYHMSVLKNLDPDKPRNLAKVVTVE